MNNSSVNDLHECSQTASGLIASSIFFLCISSFVGNILIVATFLKTSSLRTSTNYLIVNMAISDLLSSATNWPLAATEGLLSRTLVIGGSTATFACKIGHFSRAISQAVSVESLLLIVVDRYIAIVLPFQAILITRRSRFILGSLTWIFPQFLSFPFFIASEVIEVDHQTVCRTFVAWNEVEKSVFYAAGFLILYVMPFTTMIVLYLRIMKSLRLSRTGFNGEQRENQKTRNHQQNRAVMKVFALIVSCFVICWTPLCVYIVLHKTFPKSLFPKNSCKVFVVLFFYLFPSLSTVANPVILFVTSSKFSGALKQVLHCSTPNFSPWCKGRRVSAENDVMRIQVLT